MTLLTPILICLAVAMILGILWLLAPQAALQASISVGVIAALGVSGGDHRGTAAPPVVPLGSLPLQDMCMGTKRKGL